MGEAVRRWIQGHTNVALLSGLAGLLAVLAVLGARAARNAAAETCETRLYNALGADAMESLAELVEDFDLYQNEFLPLMPAGMVLDQPRGLRVYRRNPLPRKLLGSADIETWEGVNVYPVTVYEDPRTRERTVLSRTGTELLRLPAPRDYDADRLALRLYPDADPALRDPSRVSFSYRLISEPALRAYCLIKAAAKDRTDAMAAESSDDGGLMTLMGGGGGPTGIVIAGLAFAGDDPALDIAWPDGFTNRLDVYFATDLVERDWRRIAGPLPTAGLDAMVWSNTCPDARTARTGFFMVGNRDLDSDADGYSDAFERLVLKTDPQDADSHGVELSGAVLYSGSESGPVHVLAVTNAASRARTWQTVLAEPGVYTNVVGNRRDIWLKAFMDLDGDGEWSEWEPRGLHSETALHPTQDVSGLDIVLEDQPSVWGTVAYAGSATGDVYVVAVSEHGWDAAYSAFLPWVRGHDENMNPIYAEFPMDYAIVGLPPGDYYIRAFIDANGDGRYTHLEEGGQYAQERIAVAGRVVGVDFAIGLDTDGDGLPDWYEMEHSGETLFEDLAVWNQRLSQWSDHSQNWILHAAEPERHVLAAPTGAVAFLRHDFDSAQSRVNVEFEWAYKQIPGTAQQIDYGTPNFSVRLSEDVELIVYSSAYPETGPSAGLRVNSYLRQDGIYFSGSSSSRIVRWEQVNAYDSRWWHENGWEASGTVGLEVFDGRVSYRFSYRDLSGQEQIDTVSVTALREPEHQWFEIRYPVPTYGGAVNKLRLLGAARAERRGLDPSDATDAATDFTGDGRDALQEYRDGTHPLRSDTDGDGLPDAWEIEHFGLAAALNPNEPDPDADPDGDGLTNRQEFQIGTNPNLWDTDGDLIPDGIERQHYKLNPLNAADAALDYDGDGLSNLEEFLYGGHIDNPDTDMDGMNDGDEAAAGRYVVSDADPDGYAVDAELTLGYHAAVQPEGDRPSQRYRMVVWDDASEIEFLRHQPTQSFSGWPGESRVYNQFRPYRWYGARIEPMARFHAADPADNAYKADVASASPYFVVEKNDPKGLFGVYGGRPDDWFDDFALFRLVPAIAVNLAGVEPGGAEVPEHEEVEPGVVVSNGVTKLRIHNPWPGNAPGGVFGDFKVAWTNPPGKWLKVDGQNSPLVVPCAGDNDWPKDFVVTHSANWTNWVDSVLATLSHDISADTDTVRLGLLAKVCVFSDYNRDGTHIDHSNKNDVVLFEGPTGMIITPNNNDNTGDGKPDWQMSGDPPAYKIECETDLADIHVLRFARLGVPTNSMPDTMKMRVGVYEPGKTNISLAALLYPIRQVGQRGYNLVEFSANSTKFLFGGEGTVDLGIEGRRFGEEITVKLTLIVDGHEIDSDEIRLLIAPWIGLSNAHPVNKIYSGFGDVTPFKNDMNNLFGEDNINWANGTVWRQDEGVFGYACSGVMQTPFFARAAVLDMSASSDFYKGLLSPDFSWDESVRILFDGAGGGFDLSLPTTNHPFGRLIMANDYEGTPGASFFEKQRVQWPPVYLPVTWLKVGHVDEIMVIIPVTNTSIVAVADLAAAIDILGDFNNYPTQQVEKCSVEGLDYLSRATLLSIYTNPANATAVQTIQGYLDQAATILSNELGVTVVRIPVAFTLDYATGNCATFLPNSANAVVANVDGSIKVGFPDPRFHPFREIISSRLSFLGSNAGWINTDSLHFLKGHAHCASNTRKIAPNQ